MSQVRILTTKINKPYHSLGIVYANVVKPKNILSAFKYDFLGLFGYENTTYSELNKDNIKLCLERLEEEASKKGANCIINTKLIVSIQTSSSPVNDIYAYGEAIIE